MPRRHRAVHGVQRCRNEYPVRLMCLCLKVSASGYYDWQDRQPSPRAQGIVLHNQTLLAGETALVLDRSDLTYQWAAPGSTQR